MIEISRQYLEIKNLENLKDSSYSGNVCKIDQIKKPDFQLNKFLYKQIGKDHRWIDRLSWSDKLWLHYLNDKNVDTYILKVKNEVA